MKIKTDGSARSRIKAIEELAAISHTAKAEGGTVVLAHGVFDLLHMGHVRHLEAASKLGTLLIATCTGDKFVNKGPGRPAFPQGMRSEMLASLDYVDYSGVNEAADAVALLETIQPSVYAKGKDYSVVSDDVTGKIRSEIEVVERYGGHIAYTDEITFSSSALINTHFDVQQPESRAFLDELRTSGGATASLELIERVSSYRVLFIGETIIDQYDYVEAIGKAAKENIIATRSKHSELFAGGVIAAANQAAGFCREVEVITCLGDSNPHEKVVSTNLHPNVKLTPFKLKDRPTIRKRRFVEEGHLRKLFEVYYMEDKPVDDDSASKICDYLDRDLSNFDLVVVCDFGHGMMVGRIIEQLQRKAQYLAVNAQANAGNMGYNLITKYSRADYACIDGREAHLAVHDNHSEMAEIVSKRLPKLIDCARFAVTLGHRGCLAWDTEEGLVTIPAFSHTPVDTIGAGDTFLAVTSPLSAAGGGLKETAFIGNVAAGIQIGVVGHRQSLDISMVKKSIVSLLK